MLLLLDVHSLITFPIKSIFKLLSATVHETSVGVSVVTEFTSVGETFKLSALLTTSGTNIVGLLLVTLATKLALGDNSNTLLFILTSIISLLRHKTFVTILGFIVAKRVLF